MSRKLHIITTVITSIGLAATTTVPAWAHVVVRPSQVPSAAYQTFNVSVPNERDSAVTQVRLDIPANLQAVTPTVKPGWDTHAERHDNTVTSITWTGGQIPVEMRDDFSFSAKSPSTAENIIWKAYQTYADGVVVAWDKSSDVDDELSGPYSQTVVTDDDGQNTAQAQPTNATATRALYLAVAASIVSLISLFVVSRNRETKSKK